MWNDEELARIKRDDALAEMDFEMTLENEKQLVFVLVVVPHELAHELDEPDVLAVELADDARAPVLRELRELLGKVHLLHRALARCSARGMWTTSNLRRSGPRK